MTELDSSGFDIRISKCSPQTREIVSFLRTVAENAGRQVEAPTFEGRGIGITYWVNGRRFCRFDPKHEADHVWSMVPNADRDALRQAGVVSDREDGPWVTVSDMRGAVRLIPQILVAYDAIHRKK